MELSKAFFGINGKATLTLNGSRTGSVINHNNIKTHYTGYNGGAAFKILGSLANWLNVDYTGEYSFTKYKTDGIWDESDYSSFFQTISFSFFPSDKLEMEIMAEHYLSQYTGEKFLHTIFLDASIWYHINNKIQLFLHAKNLLNQHTYSYSVINPLQTSHYSYIIRPLNILIGFQIHF
jgi:hypothetical protein